MNQAIQWKGMRLVRQKRNLLLSTLPDTKGLFDELRFVRSQLAKTIQSSPTSKGWKERKDRLTVREEAAGKKLAQKIMDLGIELPDYSKQKLSLPKGSCVVDYRDFTSMTPNDAKPGRFSTEQHFLALIRKSDRSVEMVDLGSAAKIESAIARWRGPIENANKNKRAIDPTEQVAMDKAGLELRQLIWEPIEEYVANSELVIVSPDGALGRLPLIALPGKKPDSYLIEEKKIVYLPVPLLLPQMLKQRAQHLEASSNPLLVGDIRYGNKAQAESDRLVYRNSRILQNLQFGELKNSSKEIDGINQLFENSSLLTKENATETSFQEKLKDHSIVHIATHGFFQSPDRFMKHLPQDDKESFVAYEEQAKVLTENPNMLSGLAFANANAASSKTVDDAGEDGILYSAEIAMMPMEHVELAVLSACETSLGTDDNPGEGLIGIQRAFQVAGAKSTIASYWKVSDSATQMLMNKFYQNLIEYGQKAKTDGQDPNSTTVRIDALRDAQLWMLRGLGEKEIAQLNLRGLDDDKKTYRISK